MTYEEFLKRKQIKFQSTGIENPGDIILSPFAGIGSEGYVSLKLNRRFIGMELKESYFNQAVANLKAMEQQKKQMTLFQYLKG